MINTITTDALASCVARTSAATVLTVQSVCDWAFRLQAIWCLRFPNFESCIEEDNLSHFDSKIACLCQSIKIDNNKYTYT